MLRTISEAVTQAACAVEPLDEPPAHRQAIAFTAMAAALHEQGYGPDVLGELAAAAGSKDPALLADAIMTRAELG